MLGGKQSEKALYGEAMSNWYVMQVNTGKEYSTQKQCLTLIPGEDLEQVIIPTYSTKFKLHGKWIERKRILFPGYVFLVTENIERVIPQLCRVMGMTKMLVMGEQVMPITDEEEKIITRLIGVDANTNMSLGIIIGTKVVVKEGPLKGLESQIVKIDRHKRLAWISLTMFGREQTARVGLEIIEKIN